jgi:NADH-quinone oxidoreductase subunit H
VAGFHTEYGSMKFATYFMAEYMNMASISGLMTCLYFGGWKLPWISDATLLSLVGSQNILAAIQFATFIGKVSIFMLIFVWVRWTVPRFRYDQLMTLAWKNLIPIGLINLLVTAVIMYFGIRP